MACAPLSPGRAVALCGSGRTSGQGSEVGVLKHALRALGHYFSKSVPNVPLNLHCVLNVVK